MSRPLPRSTTALVATGLCAALGLVPVAASIPAAAQGPDRLAAASTETTDPTFGRIDVDTAITGASFSTVGEVFPGEQNIVTSGYGALDEFGRPIDHGTLQLYRPGASLTEWTKVPVFGPEAGLTFPNATTIDDVDGDGDNDILLASGYFFGTDPAFPDGQLLSGAITWWENTGTEEFLRHDVITGQAGSYHGVQLADLDGDGIKDLVSTAEEARAAGSQFDDSVQTQFFKGNADHTFDAPVALADVGGSQPVVADIDEDGDLDIVSSRYFDPMRGADFATFTFPAPSFLWLENTDTDGVLTGDDFTVRTMATIGETGMGFQIRPVPDFREPGTVSWIGTNHVNRCTFAILLPALALPEQVIEFTPGADLTEPWTRTTLSDPDTPVEPCPADYGSNRDNYPVFSDAITSRYGPGQGAPGVLGYGDLDGDGDVDLAVAGDGDRRLWWIESHADGSTELHQLTEDGEHFGQSGGAAVADLDGDGDNEMIFSSFDEDTLAIWSTATTATSTLKATPKKKTVEAGTKATWRVTLRAAEDGPKRSVRVTFKPKKGQATKVSTIKLGPAGSAELTGKLSWKPKRAGTLTFRYAGKSVTPLVSDTAAKATVKVRIKPRR